MLQYIFLIVFIVAAAAADSSSSEESAERIYVVHEASSFTTKIPIESVAVVKKKPWEKKVNVGVATNLAEKYPVGSPLRASLPTISPDFPETTTKSIKLAKVPIEQIAVAHKKLGEETEVATATKFAIIAVEDENENEGRREELPHHRPRRDDKIKYKKKLKDMFNLVVYNITLNF
uniref:Uncharacterized protein n=1 Tax=Panagrolaimus superbus TaxID=310955 RepID=A0A914Z9W8_9BILA